MTCGAKVKEVKITFGVYRMASGKIYTKQWNQWSAGLGLKDPVGKIKLELYYGNVGRGTNNKGTQGDVLIAPWKEYEADYIGAKAGDADNVRYNFIFNPVTISYKKGESIENVLEKLEGAYVKVETASDEDTVLLVPSGAKIEITFDKNVYGQRTKSSDNPFYIDQGNSEKVTFYNTCSDMLLGSGDEEPGEHLKKNCNLWSGTDERGWKYMDRAVEGQGYDFVKKGENPKRGYEKIGAAIKEGDRIYFARFLKYHFEAYRVPLPSGKIFAKSSASFDETRDCLRGDEIFKTETNVYKRPPDKYTDGFYYDALTDGGKCRPKPSYESLLHNFLSPDQINYESMSPVYYNSDWNYGNNKCKLFGINDHFSESDNTKDYIGNPCQSGFGALKHIRSGWEQEGDPEDEKRVINCEYAFTNNIDADELGSIIDNIMKSTDKSLINTKNDDGISSKDQILESLCKRNKDSFNSKAITEKCKTILGADKECTDWYTNTPPSKATKFIKDEYGLCNKISECDSGYTPSSTGAYCNEGDGVEIADADTADTADATSPTTAPPAPPSPTSSDAAAAAASFTKGASCTPDDEINKALTYAYDADGNCIVSNCKSGYKKNKAGTKCKKETDVMLYAIIGITLLFLLMLPLML